MTTTQIHQKPTKFATKNNLKNQPKSHQKKKKNPWRKLNKPSTTREKKNTKHPHHLKLTITGGKKKSTDP